MNTPVNPVGIAPPAARYVHAVKSSVPKHLLHTSGVVPVLPDGSTPRNLDDQADCVWANIRAILHEAEMSTANVVSVTTYVVVGENLAPVMAARDAALGDHMAASTLVTVPALARPEWRMEVAIVAAS